MGKEGYKIGGYTISDLYQGGYSTLNAPGFYVSAGTLGVTTKPQTANQIQELSRVLSTGTKNVEISAIQPEMFESIPKQQLREINRLSKLTGVDITVHAPLIEPSGFTREGFAEAEREAAERQMLMAVERSHEMNPEGNFPVTFHSSVILPGRVKPKGAEELPETLVINTETSEIKRLPLKEHHLEEARPKIENEINKINEESWHTNLNQIGYTAERASELISDSGFLALAKGAEEKAGAKIYPEEKKAEQIFNIGKNYLVSSYSEFKNLYDVAYNNAKMQEKEVLENLKRKVQSKISQIDQNPRELKNIQVIQEVIQDGLKTLSEISPPQVYKQLEQFTQDKTSTTFANVAYDSWKKFKDKTPIISIENPPVGGAFATGDELRNIVQDARSRFVERAKKEGFSESQAAEAAEKTIGVTWDVGHINMLRKYGYTKEDIVKETGKIAPLLKHVHLSDNFGFEHTELPMGMGNVPLKEIAEKLGKKAEDVKKIIEAGSWYRNFGETPPFRESLEAMGSPIYGMKMAPYWNQSPGFQQDYFGGYGQTLPQINYETFGAGFSRLPAELGGQVQSSQGGRMSGRPME